jgi:putative addiction module antidote
MTRTLKLRKMGGSAGATFPKEMLDRLNLHAGDDVNVVETDEGILLTPYDPDFNRAMELFDIIHRKYRNAFRELAK